VSFHLQRNVKKYLSEPVELRLSKASKTMWDQILRIFRDVLDKAESSYLSKAKSTHAAPVVMIIKNANCNLQVSIAPRKKTKHH